MTHDAVGCVLYPVKRKALLVGSVSITRMDFSQKMELKIMELLRLEELLHRSVFHTRQNLKL